MSLISRLFYLPLTVVDGSKPRSICSGRSGTSNSIGGGAGGGQGSGSNTLRLLLVGEGSSELTGSCGAGAKGVGLQGRSSC